MEIRQLKYFAAVADTLNFSRAAETLFISQSALSKQIADLERELGMVLLQRDKRSVRLTPAGKVFLNEAKVILMRMDTIPILLKNTKDVEKKEEHNVFIGVESRVGDSPIFHLPAPPWDAAAAPLRRPISPLRILAYCQPSNYKNKSYSFAFIIPTFFSLSTATRVLRPQIASKSLDNLNCICYSHSINCISSEHSCIGG